MSHSQPTEQELLKTLLPPLLKDFQFWFSRSRILLETEDIPFLSSQEQTNLLARVKEVAQEVAAVQMLFQATDGQVGIELSTLMPWNQLVNECCKVGMRWHAECTAEGK
jgi:hypothetical protein